MKHLSQAERVRREFNSRARFAAKQEEARSRRYPSGPRSRKIQGIDVVAAIGCGIAAMHLWMSMRAAQTYKPAPIVIKTGKS